MSDFIHLKNPPIVETAFCVTFKRDAFTEGDVTLIAQQIAPGFVKGRDITYSHFTCNMSQGPRIEQNNGWAGSRFTKDKNLVLTLQNNLPRKDTVTFAFSILPPYLSWGDFISNARPILDKLLDKLGHSSVLRVGLRTIDRMGADGKLCRIEDFFNNYAASVSSAVGAVTNDFLYRETLVFSEQQLAATVIRASEMNPESGPTVILDSDIFTNPNAKVSLEEFDALLDKMHVLRDKIFFDVVAEKYLEGCK